MGKPSPMMALVKRLIDRVKRVERTKAGLRQATVTGTSPLEVAFDGSSTSVAAIGVDGTELSVSDRVSVLVQANDFLVVGRNTDDPQTDLTGGPFQPLDSDLTAIAALSTTSFGRSLLELANGSAGRTALGVVIGTDVQAYDSDLAAIAALSTTSFGRSLLTQADAAAARSTIGAAASSHTHAQSDITSLVADLALKAPLASPALTGNPTAPTQTAGNNSTRLATTAYVDTADALKANLASPTFTGDPKAPTPSTADNDTSVATTAYVKSNLSSYAPLASPTFTGDPKAPTPSTGDNDTSIATTGFVQSEIVLSNAGYTRLPDVDYVAVSQFYDIGWSEVLIGSRSGNVLTSYDNRQLRIADYPLTQLGGGSLGVLPNNGDTLLLVNQQNGDPGLGDGKDNGIYTVTDKGSVSTPWVLTRHTDFDGAGELMQGALVRGASNGAQYFLATADPITINTTVQSWESFKFFPAEHKETHVPSGSDPLPTGTPVAVGTANSAGSADSYSKSDHVHAPLPSYGAKVYNSSSQSIGTGTSYVVVNFNSEVYDTATLHDNSTNNSRLTAPVDGLYMVSFQSQWASNSTGTRALALRVDGSTIIGTRWDVANNNSESALAETVYLTAGQYVQALVWQNSGGNLNLTFAAQYGGYFSMSRIG